MSWFNTVTWTLFFFINLEMTEVRRSSCNRNQEETKSPKFETKEATNVGQNQSKNIVQDARVLLGSEIHWSKWM